MEELKKDVIEQEQSLELTDTDIEEATGGNKLLDQLYKVGAKLFK